MISKSVQRRLAIQKEDKTIKVLRELVILGFTKGFASKNKNIIMNFSKEVSQANAKIKEIRKKELKKIEKALKAIVAYPKSKKHPRRTKDGYPSEVCYDEFAYKRIVSSYRNAIRFIIKKVDIFIDHLT